MCMIETLMALCEITCHSLSNMCFHSFTFASHVKSEFCCIECDIQSFGIWFVRLEMNSWSHCIHKACPNRDSEDIKVHINHFDLQLPCLYVTFTSSN